MKTMLAVMAAFALAACGSRGTLKSAAGEAPPAAAYGATALPTPDQLLDPSAQARPARSDELLRSSEKRRSDPFDLPPR
jgi:predicted small lipoprotein YifL